MWIQDSIVIILGVIFCEALMNLFFTAGIIQPAREKFMELTPFLSVRGEHLFSCKMCTSVWTGMVTVGVFQFAHYGVVRFIIYGIVIHRLSNYWHLLYSLNRDRQLDIRVDRNKKH
jgi:hypothetical protein